MGTAVLTSGWWRRPGRNVPGPAMAGATTPVVPRGLAVEIALDSGPTTAPSAMHWTDISAYARYDGIVHTAGRQDETGTTQPTTITMTVDNRDGRFSRLNPSGAWFGRLARGTPLRVIDERGPAPADLFVLALGYIAELPPRWAGTTGNGFVPLVASGTLRRLTQGSNPLSPLRVAFSAPPLGKTVAYWPMEDGTKATTFASAVTGVKALNVAGTVNFAASTTIPGSASLPTFTASSEVNGYLAPWTDTGQWSVSWVGVIAAAPAAEASLMSWFSTGTQYVWDANMTAAGNLIMRAYNSGSGTDVAGSASIDFTAAFAKPCLFTVAVNQSGPDVMWDFSFTYLNGNILTSSSTSNTITSSTAGMPTYIRPTSALWTGNTIGHIAVGDNIYHALGSDEALNGFLFETTGARFDRLTAGAGMSGATSRDISPDLNPAAFDMGSQATGSLLQLLRDCEDAEMGLLFERKSGYLAFRDHGSRYNRPVSLSLSFSQLVRLDTFAPADDDQRLKNLWKVSSVGGSVATVSDAASIALSGTYEGSKSVNLSTDADALTVAYMRLRQSLATEGEYRIPSISINLTRNPELVDAWLLTDIGDRVQVTSPPMGMPPDTLDLVIEGFSERRTGLLWEVTLSCSPARAWAAFQIEDATYGRLDSDTSTLTSDIGTGDTSISVTTTDGTTWSPTTPYDIAINGERITVTAVAGTSSPQTFTVKRSVNTVSVAHLAGAPVRIWHPGYVAG